MFWERLISGTLLLLLTIVLVVAGGNVLLLSVGLISLTGAFELYRTSQLEKSGLAVIGYFFIVVYHVMLLAEHADVSLFFLGGMLCLMAWYVIAYPKYRIEQVTLVLFGLVYVAAALSCIYRVRILPDGSYIVWLIFIGAWGSDTCAYCVGKLFGRHKLPSKLSPNKSVEGCIGGIAGAALIGFLYGTVFEKNFSALLYRPSDTGAWGHPRSV